MVTGAWWAACGAAEWADLAAENVNQLGERGGWGGCQSRKWFSWEQTGVGASRGRVSVTQSRGGLGGREGGPFGLEMEKMRPGVVKWLRGRILRLRKAGRFTLPRRPRSSS